MDVQQDVHALLQGKTRCLAQIVDLSRNFLSSVEATPAVNFDLITNFDQKRSDLFQVLELIDTKIISLINGVPPFFNTHPGVKTILVEHQQLALMIEAIDVKISQFLETSRLNLAREMNDQARLKDRLSKFKSQWIPDQGEGLDQTL
ncbi:MAG: hypothetical protein KGQ59_09340 [Bdellovibrionales bacterium]|nr:hypothetical protein [Bdellovibrionales bacterium]